MNLSDMTRKEQVLHVLATAGGGWVDGTELANERVGGSEGLKRLRELRAEGHAIDERRHPDSGRDIWQYRLIKTHEAGTVWSCVVCGATTTTIDRATLDPRIAVAACGTCKKRRLHRASK